MDTGVIRMVDREQIAKHWRGRGFSCELWTDRPGQRWEDFAHPTDELVLVLDGEMEFEIEGQLYPPPAGDTLFIPAGAVHSARNVGTTIARWLFGYRQ